jgi:hypothetical protein
MKTLTAFRRALKLVIYVNLFSARLRILLTSYGMTCGYLEFEEAVRGGVFDLFLARTMLTGMGW